MSKPAYEDVTQPYAMRYLPFNYRFHLSEKAKRQLKAVQSASYDPGQVVKIATELGLQQIMSMDTDDFARKVAESMKEESTNTKEKE